MKALLFDMDGTLLDSMGMWMSLESDYMRTLGVNPQEVDTDQIATLGVEETLALLKKQFGIQASTEDVKRYVQNRLHHFFSREVKLRPGVREMLSTFRELGISMAVGTATEYELAEMALKTVGIYDQFDFLQSVSTVGYSKNDRRFFYKAAERFGVEPKEICLFDDALYACVTAKVAGCYVVSMIDPAYEQDVQALLRESNEQRLDFENFDARAWARDHGLVEARQ